MNDRRLLYIDGRWTEPTGNDRLEVVNPADGQVVGSVPISTREDVDKAVEAASKAFLGWSETPLSERVRLLTGVSDLLTQRREEIAGVITQELGMPLTLSDRIQVGLPIATFASMAEAVERVSWRERQGTSLIVREPVGVVAAITPWNYPLHQIAAKVAAALAAGCTVVLKPSGLTPLSAFALFDVFDEIGFPPGVINLLSGYGADVGEQLVQHPGVDMVTFTGSTGVGRRIAEMAASTIKRVALELGGKSPSVVLDDADLKRAVRGTVASCFLNSGQSCNALTRLLVPREMLAEAEVLATQAAERFLPGDPTEPDVRMGPLVSAKQQQAVTTYIAEAVDQGAKLLVGGAESSPDLANGFFVSPTVFSEVDPAMTIAREEIFGPVLCIMSYDTEEDAIRIANDTPYGLAAAVWSSSEEHAISVAGRIRAGQIQINDGAHNASAPFGGYKQSGNGREFGAIGVEEFLETKSLQLPSRPA